MKYNCDDGGDRDAKDEVQGHSANSGVLVLEPVRDWSRRKHMHHFFPCFFLSMPEEIFLGDKHAIVDL